MMLTGLLATLLALLATTSLAQELPITETDVFIQSGEVSDSSILIMARCNNEVDSEVTLLLNGEVSQKDQVFAARDYTITFKVEGLSSNTKYTYRVNCAPLQGLTEESILSSMEGSFTTAPAPTDEVAFNFVWVADLAGQGYGRNPSFQVAHVDGETMEGGYIVFHTMEKLEPDFALFQGDLIYADNAIPPVKTIQAALGIPNAYNWTNNPSKDFVAVTLDEFRHNWKYNFGDEKMQSFLAKTPVFVQWDDHEVTNNWWPGEVMQGSNLYEDGLAVNSLFANSLQAFYEYNPLQDNQKIYRTQRFGKHVEIFFVDYRSYRDPNPDNSNPQGSSMMGAEQLAWFKDALKESTATWKIISSHDPFGIVTGGSGDYDAYGQEDPAILGREVELKEILELIHNEGITGVVSLTSDVHFTAHVNLHPDRADGNWTDFTPLDEFVIGPVHAGSFGPNFMDTSFGAQYLYEYGPLTAGFERWANLPPSQSDLQSFGHAAVAEDGTLEIKLMGIDGRVMYEKTLTPPVVDDDNKAPSSAVIPSAILAVVAFSVTFSLF
eukprot:scaffold24048_cov194-Amphora_coffeaeformis.AAC.20